MADFSRYQGIGATSQRVRSQLVDMLADKGLVDAKVKSVMKVTPRHFFIDEAMSRHAYENVSLPIGFAQTISQPQVVALMSQALIEQGKCRRVFEVGTGCGYQTAILAQLFEHVETIERIEGLHQRAQEKLGELKFDNITFHHGDGINFVCDDDYFDAILLTAAPDDVPKDLLKKLAVGGRLVAPIGSQKQTLMRFMFDGHQVKKESLGEVSFVPLLGGAI